jgi:hypothetical protein
MMKLAHGQKEFYYSPYVCLSLGFDVSRTSNYLGLQFTVPDVSVYLFYTILICLHLPSAEENNDKFREELTADTFFLTTLKESINNSSVSHLRL